MTVKHRISLGRNQMSTIAWMCGFTLKDGKKIQSSKNDWGWNWIKVV